MATENALDDAEKLEKLIEEFMDIENIAEEDLYIDLQLELDEEDDQYFIDYGVKEAYNGDSEVIGRKFTYENLKDAWANYIDQLPELHQSFPEATIKSPHPETYESAKGGGNPLRRLGNSGSEI
jgi:hypothetical protein